MLLGAFSELELQEAGASISSAALPIVVAASGIQVIVFEQMIVPFDEMWLVSYAGFAIEVNDSRVRPFGAQTNATYAFVSTTGFGGTGPVGRTPVIPFTNAFNPNLSAERTTGIPSQNTTVIGGPGAAWYYGSVALSGIRLMPQDSVTMGITVDNTDAALSHNVTDGYAGIRYQPIKLVTNIEIARLQQARVDPGLSARLAGSRG